MIAEIAAVLLGVLFLMGLAMICILAALMAFYAVIDALRSEWFRRFQMRVAKGIGKLAKRLFKCSKD